MSTPRFLIGVCATLVVGSLAAQPVGRTDALFRFEAVAHYSSLYTHGLWWLRPDGTAIALSIQQSGPLTDTSPATFFAYDTKPGSLIATPYQLEVDTYLPGHNRYINLPGALSMMILFDTHTTTYPAGQQSSSFAWMSRTEAPMQNTSVRGYATADHSCITGLSLTQQRYVLIRAIGPTLATFGVSDAMPSPMLRAYTGATLINDSETMSSYAFYGAQRTTAPALWFSNAVFEPPMRLLFDMVGAFQLPANTADRATLMLLPAGTYSFEAKPREGTPAGTVLVEAYVLPYGEEVPPQ